ncbi:MAG: hypothetical protein HKM07_08005 [Chlamydiae bacterium]|nr:hypothetical protein [Chlamydiota bacterium]
MRQKPFTKDIQSMISLDTFSSSPIENDAQKLPADQRGVLAESFLAQGEMLLLKGNAKGLPLLETASKLDPNNPRLFYRQGLSLLEYGNEDGKEKIVLLACKKFKKAVSVDSNFFEAWNAWGSALIDLGNMTGLHHYFLEAKEKLEKALPLSSTKTIDCQVDLYWNYAITWRFLADHSGEAVDLYKAFEAFQKVADLQENDSYDFWVDFGNTSFDLAALVNDNKLYVKAIFCYKQAVSLQSSLEEAWELLAKTFYTLYKSTHDEDQFVQATDCYNIAAKIKPEKAQIWIDWAEFLSYSGKHNVDTKRLRASVEKCSKAAKLLPNDPMTLSIWSESLSMLGEIAENLDFILDAESKVLDALDYDNSNPKVWYSYGMCMYAFGKYFQDVDYFEQAIEKLQCGLSIDRTRHDLWHAMAKSNEMIALMLVDHESFARGCRFYIKAIELHPSSYYLYDFALFLSKFGEMTHNQSYLEQSVLQFEQALQLQKNAIYVHPDWLFSYASAIDMLGDFFEETSHYTKAIDILLHVLMLNPDFPQIHHRLALAYSHLGDLSEEIDHFYRALHHYRIAAKREEENDYILLDWGTTLVNASRLSTDGAEKEALCKDAENKLVQAAKLGNIQVFYPLACLFSMQGNHEKALRYLQKSNEVEALPPLDEMLNDEWLEEFRETPFFKELINEIEKQAHTHEEK